VKTQDEPQSPIAPIAAPAVEAPPVNTSDVGGIASLDKVREILFGGQLRELEGRVERLEARLAKDASELREEVLRRLGALEERSVALDEQITAAQRESWQNHIEMQQQMTDEIRHQVDHALLTLAREVQELRTDKADRAALAALLQSMANRLIGDNEPPGGQESGGG
jgi:hypothetical protein